MQVQAPTASRSLKSRRQGNRQLLGWKKTLKGVADKGRGLVYTGGVSLLPFHHFLTILPRRKKKSQLSSGCGDRSLCDGRF